MQRQSMWLLLAVFIGYRPHSTHAQRGVSPMDSTATACCALRYISLRCPEPRLSHAPQHRKHLHTRLWLQLRLVDGSVCHAQDPQRGCPVAVPGAHRPEDAPHLIEHIAVGKHLHSKGTGGGGTSTIYHKQSAAICYNVADAPPISPQPNVSDDACVPLIETAGHVYMLGQAYIHVPQTRESYPLHCRQTIVGGRSRGYLA